MTRAVVWFRRDLSLGDNEAFARGSSFDDVACAWVLEPTLLQHAGPYRRRFLLSAVRALADDITLRGGSLTILAGPAVDAIPRFAARIGADEVAWNGDVSAYAQWRDTAVEQALSRHAISSSVTWGTLVHAPGSVLTASGTVPRVFKRFYDLWSVLPLEHATAQGTASFVHCEGDGVLPVDESGPLDASEGAARARLQQFLRVIDDYDELRDRPDRDGTSRLSADLRFGTICPSRVASIVGNATSGRRAFVRQLAWRDWYAHLFCERPDLATTSQNPAYDTLRWRNDRDEIDAWREGRTGYPIVDAAMRELAATGWLHNRLRMVVASFLVKDLLVDWRIGEQHFRRLLVDGDVAQNAGNWQWSAGTGPDAAPYFRIMNPITQGRRHDPNGDYVRAWLPELATLRGANVHAPFELGPLELASAGIILGVNYPAPIVEHSAARVRALAAYQSARRSAGIADEPA